MQAAPGKLTLTMEREARVFHRHRRVALAVVQMVRAAARQHNGEFERLNHEWRLLPDDRLKLKFILHSHVNSSVRVSVNLPADSFSGPARQWVKPGRWNDWSVFRIQQRKQLPLLQECLQRVLGPEPPVPSTP